jgi:hypothetical protein
MLKPKGVIFLILVILLMAFSCSGPDSDQPLLTADLPIHLEENIDAALIEGSEIPVDPAAVVEWRFDELQPEWGPARHPVSEKKPIETTPTEDSLRLVLSEDEATVDPFGTRMLGGGIYVEVPEWKRED